MDWPGFALVTYTFFLALLLAGIILRSLRETKGRYQRLLEEKEKRLAAMQMDAEDTLETLQDQAAALEAEWSAAQRRAQESTLAVQQRLLEIQGALVSLQSRLSRLEQAPRQQAAARAAEPFLSGRPEAACGEPSEMEPPRSLRTQNKAAPEEKSPEENGSGEKAPGERNPCPKGSPEREPPRQRALALLQSGMSIAQVSREMGCSWTEATLLYSQWRRGYLKEDMEDGPEN